jgi:Fe-S-cluster containining protein
MDYIPWKQIDSWMCLGCGKCCYRYRIQLKDEEAAVIRKYWSDAVEERGDKIYLRKIGKKCLFQSGKLCALQPLGLKPMACRTWPFYVSTRPLRAWKDKKYQAQFLCRGKEYFVYVNTMCLGVNKGTRRDLRKVISEVIMLRANPEEQQHHSTSSRFSHEQKKSSEDIWRTFRNLQNVDFIEYEFDLSKPDPLIITPKKVRSTVSRK